MNELLEFLQEQFEDQQEMLKAAHAEIMLQLKVIENKIDNIIRSEDHV